MSSREWKEANKEKQIEYKRKHYEKNKREVMRKAKEYKNEIKRWLEEYKSKLKCELCSENHPAALDFHHRDPTTKSFDIAQCLRLGKGRESILAEIEKCCVLCSNCHRKLHWKERISG
ncbi:hypothetical protein [Cohnella yongneupensis]|uniref:HNH endonuclease n=1 Tax=Cohnella yongneupensis TaxID=425006 RepID=A0ABW0QWS7_9BACL